MKSGANLSPLQIDDSYTIVVVGGGATAVELCGELSDAYLEQHFNNQAGGRPKNRRVILVHSGPRLLSMYASLLGTEAQKAAWVQLESKGVEVKLSWVKEKGV